MRLRTVRRFGWPGVGSFGPPEFVVSLYGLAGLFVFVLAGLLWEGNFPKAVRVGLSALTYLAVLVGGGLARGSAGPGSKRIPFWLFLLAGSGACLVSGVVRADPTLPIIAAQTAGAGVLLGGLHGIAVRTWRRVQERLAAPDPS